MEFLKEPLLDGYVLFPKDFVLADCTRTQHSNYAGVVTEKKGRIKRYLIFSDTPVSEYSADDEDRLFHSLVKNYPEIQQALLQEVDREYDDNGVWVNKEEWDKAPRVVLFPVKEVPDDDTLYYGTGVRRKEA